MRFIVPIIVGAMLAGCATAPQTVVPPPKGHLPAAPADIARCFNESVGAVPDRDLTVEDVERLWKSDRLRAVVMARCGKRFLAWYGELRKDWE